MLLRRYLLCPATVAPVVSEAVYAVAKTDANVYEQLTPSDGWAPVTPTAPDGFVVYQCPASDFRIGTLT